MTINPIETNYAGCRFRSRLEARWAVFFDHLGIKWEYEPQGYQLSTGPYLPDFLLECGTWVEVKGDLARLDKKALRIAAAELPFMSAVEEHGPDLMILGPIPDPALARNGDFGWVSFYARDGAVDAYRTGFGSYYKNRRPWWHSSVEMPHGTPLPPHDAHLIASVDPNEPGVPDAYFAARRARFEHGESG